MKIKVKRVVSALMVVVMTWLSIPQAYATGNIGQNEADMSPLVFGDVTITAFEDQNGNAIISEYQDGVLTQQNIVSCEDSYVVVRNYYDTDGKHIVMSNYLNVNEVGIISQSPSVELNVSSGYTPFGKIEYKVIGDDSFYDYYTQIVGIRSSVSNTTYTLDKWKGAIIDLISLLVSAGIGTAGIVKTYVKNFLVAAGFTVVGNAIKEEISTIVHSTKTTYTWQMYDSVFKSESFVTGARYNITETGIHYGEVHYEGVTPGDWGTSSMSSIFYYQNYVYSNWGVNKWIVDSQNNYI